LLQECYTDLVVAHPIRQHAHFKINQQQLKTQNVGVIEPRLASLPVPLEMQNFHPVFVVLMSAFQVIVPLVAANAPGDEDPERSTPFTVNSS
jgi:hypothetical protein